MVQPLIDLADYVAILGSPIFEQIVLAILSIIVGVIVAKLLGSSIIVLNKQLKLGTGKPLRSFTRLVELFIVVVSIIIALSFLQVNAAQVIIQSLLQLTPSLIILLLLLFLGFIIINLVIDLIKSAFLRVGFTDYLSEMGLSVGFLNNFFLIIKLFLFLILFSISFNFVGISVPFIDHILIAVIYGFVLLSIALIFFIFKEPLANFFIGAYIEKGLLKPGQSIMIGKEFGEVIGVTAHGTLIRLPTGYNLLIPNKDLIKEKIYIKRTKQDISKLESIRSNFITQLPAYCGPASTAMMLRFFGYEADQEEIAKLSGTKRHGGTGPKKLIEAVRKISGNSIKGVLIGYDEITDLKEELKTWLSEGALAILWFNKPAIFKTSKGRGHYVLCVGVEGDELIIMDPSKATAGVYLIDYRLLEEAMSEFDRKRGYIVFARKGTSSYWRIGEGLVYVDISAYKELSKSFERYLKRVLRKSETIHQLLSEQVFKAISAEEKRVKRVWKPEFKKKIEIEEEKAKE